MTDAADRLSDASTNPPPVPDPVPATGPSASTASPAGNGGTDQLDSVRASVLAVLTSLPDPPTRLMVRSGAVTVELEWPDRERVVAAEPAEPAGMAPDAEVAPAGEHRVTAPSVGTFYRAPEPGAAPFVREGDIVATGQRLALVETMKLMLPVEADRPGRLVEVVKSDGDPVEFGEPLFVLRLVEPE